MLFDRRRSTLSAVGSCRYEEWWIGPPSGNPTEMTEWRRPYRDTKMAPHDIWLMAQPVTTESAHVWVDNGIVWGLPLYRLAGVYSPGNGEFSTAAFPMPEKPLWINAECASERPAEHIMSTFELTRDFVTERPGGLGAKMTWAPGSRSSVRAGGTMGTTWAARTKAGPPTSWWLCSTRRRTK